jgi:hypothetical protein
MPANEQQRRRALRVYVPMIPSRSVHDVYADSNHFTLKWTPILIA